MEGGITFDKNVDLKTYQINSSLSTVFSLLNSMIGGTMLILPIYFNTTGLIMSTLITIVMGIISYKGCDIYIQHMKPNEFDIQDILKRLMGRRWSLLFVVIASINLFLVVILYYSFSIEMIFNIITFIMYEGGSDSNISSGTLSNNINDLKLWTFNIGELASTASMAFSIQTNVCPMMICHKYQNKNRMVIKITYVLGALIYLMIGIIGGLGVLGRTSTTGESALNINDFFSTNDWQPLIVEMIYLVHLVSMYPIIADICRNRIFEIIYKDNGGKPPKFVLTLSNLILILICAVLKTIGVSPNLIVSINGSFSCFFIVYLIPSLLHLECYYQISKFFRSFGKGQLKNIEISVSDDGPIQNSDSQANSEFEQQENNEEEKMMISKCNNHSKDINSLPKTLRIMIFVLIIMIGIVIFIYGMYQVIANAINGDD